MEQRERERKTRLEEFNQDKYILYVYGRNFNLKKSNIERVL